MSFEDRFLSTRKDSDKASLTTIPMAHSDCLASFCQKREEVKKYRIVDNKRNAPKLPVVVV